MFPQFSATKRFELIEVQIPATSTATKFNIPDQPQLRTDQDADIIIQAIETYDILSVPLSPNNVAVVTSADLLQTYITLYIDGEESIYRVPLVSMKRILNETTGGAVQPSVFEIFKLRNLKVDWTKSYFFTPVAYAGGANATFSFLLGVHYYKLPPGTMKDIEDKELYLLRNP